MTGTDTGLAAPSAAGSQLIPAELYLDLLKRVLTNMIYQDLPVHRPASPSLYLQFADPAYDSVTRSIGQDWPSQAHTMIGLRRMDNLQQCLHTILSGTVPGDLAETGVWRGGSVIFMLAFLTAYEATDRAVWAADTFSGVPEPADPGNRVDLRPAWNTLNDILSVDAAQVRQNVQRYGLDDTRIRFLEGRFRDTLPQAPIERLALLRLDSGTYEGTADALEHLYPKLSPGGFLIVSDYVIDGVRRAVNEYRRTHSIRETLRPIDHSSDFWRHPGGAARAPFRADTGQG